MRELQDYFLAFAFLRLVLRLAGAFFFATRRLAVFFAAGLALRRVFLAFFATLAFFLILNPPFNIY